VDEGGDDETGADTQRGENFGKGRPAGKLHFLGYTLGTTPLSQRWPLVSGRKPVQEERAADQDERQRTADAGEQGRLARLNRLLGGWSAYFSHGALASVYRAVDDHVYDRVRNFLRRRHKAPGRLARTSTRNWACCAFVAGAKGPDVCLTMKPVGKPDAGNPHVRFDERGGETERCRMAQATAPLLDSTGSAFEEAGKADGQVVWRLHQYEGGTLFNKTNGQIANGQIANGQIAKFPIRSRPSSTSVEEEETFRIANAPNFMRKRAEKG
jgi:group II intron maturase